MSQVLSPPRRPVTDWPIKLAEWKSEVQQIVDTASQWAKEKGWDIVSEEKVITEDVLGSYEVPRLLIHRPDGRLVLDPIARYVVGASGRFEFCVLPSYDSALLVKDDDGWRFYSQDKRDQGQPWSREAFYAVCNELVRRS
jgi:hypothetical protein